MAGLLTAGALLPFRHGLAQPQAWTPLSYPGIDAHCHVFNGSDLSIRGFIWNVVIGGHGRTRSLDPYPERSRALNEGLADLVIELLLNNRAPTAEDELRQIEQNGVSERSVPDRGQQQVLQLGEALRNTFEGTNRRAPELRLHNDPAMRDMLRRALEREAFGAERDPSERALQPGYEDMAARLLGREFGVGTTFRWVLKFLRKRGENIEELVSLYGGEGRIKLFCPALVDFAQWLSDEPLASVETQISLMERLQRTDRSAMIHSFVPFDPWRQINDGEDHTARTALDLIKWAIADMGFIGVKLYPPMGFRPAGNEGAGLSYPRNATDRYGASFPGRLDTVLKDLYRWAAEEDVPIMAHAANSQGAGTNYAERAFPGWWRDVLRAHPKLRLNLAHLGGFNPVPEPGSPVQTWESTIGGMIKDDGFLNLYADLSYFSDILSDPTRMGENASDEVEEHSVPDLRILMTKYLADFDPEVDHLLYGCDWIMLGREADCKSYLEKLDEFLGSIGVHDQKRKKLFGENAARFLGLRRGNKTRDRLNAYYTKHGLDKTKLEAFDV